MKIFDFLDLDLSKQNQFKFRKIKLLICSLLLIISFTIIGYRTISLASINKENISNKAYVEIENETIAKSLKQAQERSSKLLNKKPNKGSEAAKAVISILNNEPTKI